MPSPRELVIRSVLGHCLREILKDGHFDAEEQVVLKELCQQLQIPQAILDEMIARTRLELKARPDAGAMDRHAVLRHVERDLAELLEPERLKGVLTRVARALKLEPSGTGARQTPAPPARPDPPPPAAASPAHGFRADESLEQQFIHLVEDSWRRYDEVERTTWIDDTFLGEVITVHLDDGKFLLDLTSDGKAHYLLFSDQDRTRYVVRLDHSRAEDFAFARSVGHLTTVTLGYSRVVADISKIFQAMKSEFKSSMAGEGRIEGYVDPGVIKVDAEGTTATAETSLLLELRDYVDPESLRADREKLWSHLRAVYQSLEKYLDGILS